MTTTQAAAQIFEAFITLRVMGTATDASSFDAQILSLSLADLGNQVDGNALLASSTMVVSEAVPAAQAIHRIEEIGGDVAAFGGGAFLDVAPGEAVGEPADDLVDLIEAGRVESGLDHEAFSAQLVEFVLQAGGGHALRSWLGEAAGDQADACMLIA